MVAWLDFISDSVLNLAQLDIFTLLIVAVIFAAVIGFVMRILHGGR